MKRYLALAGGLLALGMTAAVVWRSLNQPDDDDDARYARGETEVEVVNLAGARLSLHGAGNVLGHDRRVALPEAGTAGGQRLWLAPGRFFLRADIGATTLWYPIPLAGYRSGPDEDGLFRITVRNAPERLPPVAGYPGASYLYIPAGTFLLGDSRSPRESHHVWLPAFFVAAFEVTNGEFREFLSDPGGYGSSKHWTEAGWRWRSSAATSSTAALKPGSAEYDRFGMEDQPVVWVTWFEADAYCSWLTTRSGEGQWLFTLPGEAEWEKVARGPEGFDYALGMQVSDADAPLYNWGRNPSSDTTLVGVEGTRLRYTPNRYGAYHLTGNALEWTRSVFLPYNREKPYEDGPGSAREASGRRVARGGSWYSGSNAYLLNSYRDAFQPEHSSQELGFRIIAKRLP